MQGYGTHGQPPGTFSDDSSLAFCLAESLCRGYNLTDLANRFINWRENGYWTAHERVFDIGIATSAAITRLMNGTAPLLAGGMGELDNGNGSLMRILPLVFFAQHKPIEERYRLVAEVSALTHGHIRSVLACFIYCEYARLLLTGQNKWEAFRAMQHTVNEFVADYSTCNHDELSRFHRVLENPDKLYEVRSLIQYAEEEIASSGYVLHTLEASLWCFLCTESYAEATLKAVNLGSDTDTTGCITGGLAGIYYGAKTIPAHWLSALARRNDIVDLADRLAKECAK